MRNIWNQPPGGLTPEARRNRRRRRIQVTISSLVVVAVALTLARTAVLQTEPVTEAEALATYRASVDRKAHETEPSQRGPSRPRTRVVRVAAAGSSDQPNGSVTNPDPNDAGAGRSGPARVRSEREPTRPLEGVYTWDVEGYEEASGGTRRDLPRESHRVITHGDGGTWVEHHIFSQQREEWFEVDRSDAGLLTDAVRNRIEFGPVEVDETVTFNPSVLGARAPFRVDDSWSGSWTGPTEGDYRARIFEHGTMTIDGERVEVWGTEVLMHMRGEVEGDVLTRSWIAPDYGLVVKQHQVISVENGPYSYHSEWTGRVRSLTPAT